MNLALKQLARRVLHLEAILRELEHAEQEDIRLLFSLRDDVFENASLLESLGITPPEVHRIEAIDEELRRTADWFLRRGLYVPLSAAATRPPEYWWWKLAPAIPGHRDLRR